MYVNTVLFVLYNLQSLIYVRAFFGLSGNSRTQKSNRSQTKRANITGVQNFCGVWSCLCMYQNICSQLCFILYTLCIELPYNLRQIPFYNTPLPPIEFATTNRVHLHHQHIIPPPWFGRAYKRIRPHLPLTTELGRYENDGIPLRQTPRLRGCIHSPFPPPKRTLLLQLPPPPKP